jgi:type IX secretion system PorP/SprF family membrane protein
MNKAITLFLLFVVGSSFAQDVVFSQKRGNLVYFNPALVGTESYQAISINYQNQWPNDNWEYITSSLNANYNLKNNWGFGLSLMNDKGLIRAKRSLRINTNYQKNINELTLKCGLNVAILQNKLDFSRANFLDPGDPILDNETKSTIGLGLDLGGALYFKGIFINAAIFQLNSPQLVYGNLGDKIHRRFNAGVGYSKNLSELNISGMVNYSAQGNLKVIQGQIASTYKFLHAGFGLNNGLEKESWYSAMAGVQFPYFAVSYSTLFDLKPSQRTVAENTHQITASWYIKALKKDDKLSEFIQIIF